MVTLYYANFSNYDSLVERAFCEFGDEGIGELYAAPLTPVEWRYGQEMWALAIPRSKVRLYKLHGSITWLFSGSDSASGETIYYWGDQDKWTTPIRRDLPADKVPLLLPPVANKGSLFHHETVRSVWIRAAKALRQAKPIFSLGYSLPLSDELIRFFLLTNAATPGRTLYIADVRNTSAHFKDRLKLQYEINGRFSGIGQPVPELLESLSRGDLEVQR